MLLLGMLIGAGAVRFVLEEPDVSDEWRAGVYAALDAVAAENGYARNAAARVRGRIHECLGAGKQWSEDLVDCERDK